METNVFAILPGAVGILPGPDGTRQNCKNVWNIIVFVIFVGLTMRKYMKYNGLATFQLASTAEMHAYHPADRATAHDPCS